MMNDDIAILPTVAPDETGVGLLVEFETPVQPEPDQRLGARVMEVETMSGTRRVQQQDFSLSRIPPVLALGVREEIPVNLRLGKRSLQPREVRLEVVANHDGTVSLLHDLQKHLDLPPVEFFPSRGHRVHGTISKLQEFSGQHPCVNCGDVLVIDLDHIVSLKRAVLVPLFGGQVRGNVVPDYGRQLQVILLTQGEADIVELLHDLLFGVSLRSPLKLIVTGRIEPTITEGGQCLAETFALI